MPMLDAYIPAGALSPVAERALMSQLTDLLLRHEGADPSDPRARAIAWVFLHRPAEVFVAGEPASEPRYRIIASVPEGQFDDERRAAIVRDVTDAVLRAENNEHPYDPKSGVGVHQRDSRRHVGRRGPHQHTGRHRRLYRRRCRERPCLRRATLGAAPCPRRLAVGTVALQPV